MCAFIALTGCGTRKVDAEKIRTETKVQQELEAEGESERREVFTTQDKALNIDSKTSQTTEQGEFDSITGKLIKGSRTANNTSLVITKTVNTTERIFHDVEKWKIKNKVITNTITVYKSKKSTSSRDGLYYLGGFGLLILGVLAWLKWVR